MSANTGAAEAANGTQHRGDPVPLGQLLANSSNSTEYRQHQAAQSAWEACVASFADLSATHKAWLAQAHPVALVGETFVLAVPDEFVRSWIQQRYLPATVEQLARAVGRALDLKVVVDESGDGGADTGLDDAHNDAGEQAAARAARAAKAAALQLEERWRAACPRKFWGTRLDSVPVPESARVKAARYARRLVDGKSAGGNLLITGSTGVAKTGLALAIGRVALEASLSLRFTSAYDLLQALRRSYSAAICEYTQPDVLILEFDEMLCDPNDWQSEQYFGLVNRRDFDVKPIIVTTNRPPRDARLKGGTVVPGLASLLSKATWDRLRDGAEIITIVGESLRRPRPRLEPVDQG